jgi:hypothetical protein
MNFTAAEQSWVAAKSRGVAVRGGSPCHGHNKRITSLPPVVPDLVPLKLGNRNLSFSGMPDTDY